jgi:hypothetical protein
MPKLRQLIRAAFELSGFETQNGTDGLTVNGYTSPGFRTVPDYRVLRGTPIARNPYTGWHPIGGPVDALRTLPNGQPIAVIEDLGPVFSWAKVSIFAGPPESKSERTGIKSRTPFAAFT